MAALHHGGQTVFPAIWWTFGLTGGALHSGLF